MFNRHCIGLEQLRYVFLDMHQDAFGTTNGGDTWQILAVLALTSRTLELLRPREPTWSASERPLKRWTRGYTSTQAP